MILYILCIFVWTSSSWAIVTSRKGLQPMTRSTEERDFGSNYPVIHIKIKNGYRDVWTNNYKSVYRIKFIITLRTTSFWSETKTLLSLQVGDGNRELEQCELFANRSRPSELFASELITSLLSVPPCFPDRCASCDNVINSCFSAAGSLRRDGSHSGEENRSKTAASHHEGRWQQCYE